MKRIIEYLLLTICIVLFACSDNQPIKLINSEEYFPMQVGKYWIYSVSQTIHSETAPTQVNVFELKSEVVNSFENLDGGTTYVIHNSKRISPENSWEYVETLSARIDEFKVVLTEDGVAYVQLTFPLYRNKRWNGNEFNTYDSDDYIIGSVGNDFTTSADLNFEDCVVLNKEIYLDALKKDDRVEVYSRHVGLVYKRAIGLTYDDDFLGEFIIKSGEEWIQELKSYGQN